MDKKKIRRRLILKKYMLELLQLTIGTIIMALGVAQFLLPNKLSSGGFSGIATIPYYFFGWSVGKTILVLNIPCFTLAFVRIGKEFLAKTLIGTVLLSLFIDWFSMYPAITHDKVLACIYGGVLIGFGTAIILKSNASTGGSDLVSFIIKSFKPGLSTGNLIIIFDVIVIALNVIAFRQLDIGLYSTIAILIMGKMIDIVFEGIGFSKMIFIISEKYEKIAKEIGKEISRGTTGIYSKGMYTNKDRMMIMCIASRGEVIKVRQIANKIDKSSFIIISNAREVFGKGFKKQ